MSVMNTRRQNFTAGMNFNTAVGLPLEIEIAKKSAALMTKAPSNMAAVLYFMEVVSNFSTTNNKEASARELAITASDKTKMHCHWSMATSKYTPNRTSALTLLFVLISRTIYRVCRLCLCRFDVDQSQICRHRRSWARTMLFKKPSNNQSLFHARSIERETQSGARL